jgi:predicted Zn-dependent protease
VKPSAADDLLAALRREGFEEVEIYRKQGRSRRVELGALGSTAALCEEEGWAVRAAAGEASAFFAGTGRPPAQGPWPRPAPGRLRLPPPRAVPAFREPASLAAPLIGESEGGQLLQAVAERLAAQRAGARLTAGLLEDGASEWEVASSRGVRERARGRGAAVRLRAVDGAGGGLAELHLAAAEARALSPAILATRLADALAVRAGPPLGARERGDVVCAPPVAARLLAGLAPLLVGREASERAAAMADRAGSVAGRELTIVDDGRLAGGALAAPIDGEGMPTRRVVVIEAGRFRQPLLDWRAAEAPRTLPSGCVRRASWRDVPAPGPTHLYIEGRSDLKAASLVAGVARGFYLLETVSAGAFAVEEDRFALPVCGFELRDGRAAAAFSRAWLTGAVSALLRGVRAAARDLAFLPLDGMIGAPTLLVAGLELRPEPA